MRVLMLVQHLEESHWLRGFIVKWVRALAAEVEHIHVITLEMGNADLPENVSVQSMGKEKGYGRLRELMEFQRAIGRVIQDVDVVFSHMTPRYTIVAAPHALLYNKPQFLWYTHRNIYLELQIATRLCHRVVTAAPESFPLATPKCRAIGHGINTAFFSPDESVPPAPSLIVHVARLMPIKHQATVIRALAQIAPDTDAKVAIIGGVPDDNDQSYLTGLEQLAADLGVADRVTFTGAIQAEELRDWYRQAAVAVNPSPVGLFDKAVLESMATGTPTIVSNPAFDSLLGDYVLQLRIDAPDDVDGLAERLRALLARFPEEHRPMTQAIRERVVEAHSLEHLMVRLVNVFRNGEP